MPTSTSRADAEKEEYTMDLSAIALTAYVLVWPVIVAGTLTVIVRAFVAEARKAKAEGRSII